MMPSLAAYVRNVGSCSYLTSCAADYRASIVVSHRWIASRLVSHGLLTSYFVYFYRVSSLASHLFHTSTVEIISTTTNKFGLHKSPSRG
jgi:hypothetical protein